MTRRQPNRIGRASKALSLSLIAPTLILSGFSQPARAADGRLVLLCLAAPSWSSIAQCIDPVRQVLRDLARGRPFPSCPMAGAGNSASNQWSNPPTFCPPQYTRTDIVDPQPVYGCDYDGAVAVNVKGGLWSRTWWRLAGGNTVTEFTPAAKAQLGTWETRFDDDYAAWLASVPPAQPTCSTC